MKIEEIWDLCISEAKISYNQGDVPIGAVLVKDNEVLASAHNTREIEHNILGHAEINVILQASERLKRWNLSDCSIYVTLKPCSMCYEVIKQSRIANVYYLLDKLDYKKEFSKTKFVKFYENGESGHEQMYHKLLKSFFQQKRQCSLLIFGIIVMLISTFVQHPI